MTCGNGRMSGKNGGVDHLFGSAVAKSLPVSHLLPGFVSRLSKGGMPLIQDAADNARFPRFLSTTAPPIPKNDFLAQPLLQIPDIEPER